MRLFILAFTLVGSLTACAPSIDSSHAGPEAASCATRAYAEIGGPINLINETGTSVTEADFKGEPSLIYFGFTHCPDVCPTALVTIDRALRRLPETIEPPRTILISVDPERDTPEAMKAYIETGAFPDKITGLTGTPEAVRAAADTFLTGYEKVETPESLVGYTVDHQSIIYLMDENWSLTTFFTHSATDADIAHCLEKQLG